MSTVFRWPFGSSNRKKSQTYQSEHALVREMLAEVRLPVWCKKVVVVADAAYPSRANPQAIQARGWFFVIAFPRTWKLVNGQHLRDVVTHLPIHRYRQGRVPSVVPPTRRRVFWTFAKQAQVAHGGDVTVVVSRRRRNDSPETHQTARDQSTAGDRTPDRGTLSAQMAGRTLYQRT